MRKIKALMIFALILTFLLCAIPAMAVSNAAFEVATVAAAAGDQVEVTISVKNSPGITSTKLEVTFDDALKLNNVTYGTEITGNFVKPMDMTSPVILNWANGLENFSGDYLFATLSFAVSADAAEGLYPITVTYDPDDVFDIDEENAAFDIINGGVNIKTASVSVAGVAINKNTLTIKSGQSEMLVATIDPADASNKDIIWKSSDESIVSVDSGGKVLGIKKGRATVTVTTADGGKSASCVVTVLCGHNASDTVPAKEPTCTEPGNHAYDVCTLCGQVFKYGTNTETAVESEMIPALGHHYAVATCTAPKTCKVCGETEGAIVAHTDANADNKCDMCGTVLKEEQPTNPAPTDPAPTDPAPTDPAPTDPAPTDPKPTEPDVTEPMPTEMAPTVPEAEGPQTGDTMDFLPWAVLLIMSFVGIVLCLVLLERKRKAV